MGRLKIGSSMELPLPSPCSTRHGCMGSLGSRSPAHPKLHHTWPSNHRRFDVLFLAVESRHGPDLSSHPLLSKRHVAAARGRVPY